MLDSPTQVTDARAFLYYPGPLIPFRIHHPSSRCSVRPPARPNPALTEFHPGSSAPVVPSLSSSYRHAGSRNVRHARRHRFTEMIDAIEAAGMVPNATLHHFTHPDWWEDRGGFEREENLPAFLEYCRFCAATWGRRVKMWCTFNEPTCALVCGWLIGAHPPGKLMQFGLMGRVLCNILKAHAAAYTLMKAQPGCEDLQIGLVHHHVEFMPSSPWWAWLRPLCWWGTFWWGRDTVLHFLQTGEFTWHVPLWGKSAHLPPPRRRPCVLHQAMQARALRTPGQGTARLCCHECPAAAVVLPVYLACDTSHRLRDSPTGRTRHQESAVHRVCRQPRFWVPASLLALTAPGRATRWRPQCRHRGRERLRTVAVRLDRAAPW